MTQEEFDRMIEASQIVKDLRTKMEQLAEHALNTDMSSVSAASRAASAAYVMSVAASIQKYNQ